MSWVRVALKCSGRRLVYAIVLQLTLFVNQALAEPVILSGAEVTLDPARMDRLVATGPLEPVEAALSRLRTGDGEAGPALGSGLSWRKVWLLAEVEAERDGAWHIASALPYAADLEIFVVAGEAISEPLLSASFKHGFDTRPIESRTLVSAPFELLEGERTNLLIGYRPVGFSALPLTVVPKSALPTRLISQSWGSGVFYAACLTILAAFTAFCVVTRTRAGGLVAGQLALHLGLLAQIEGQFFMLLWPDAPLFNLNAALPIMLVAAALGFWTSARLGGGALIYRAGFWASLATLLALPFMHPTLITLPAIALWLAMFSAFFVSVATWDGLSRGQRRFGAALAAGLALMLLALTVGAMRPDAPGWLTGTSGPRVAFAGAAVGLITLMLAHVSQIV